MSVRNQKVWGPHAWHFLHSVAETYTPDKADAMRAFVASLPTLLPCPACGEHLTRHLAVLDLEAALRSSQGMSDYMWMLHNRVNRDIGKASWPRDAPRIPQVCSQRKTLWLVLVMLLVVAVIVILKRR